MSFLFSRRRRGLVLWVLLLLVLLFTLRGSTDAGKLPAGTPIRSDPSWAPNPSSPLLRPFFTLAAKFTRPPPHVLFLGAFDGSSGGVENYLARRLALGGTRVSVVDVPSGGTRRRIDGLRSSIKLAFAGRSKGEETAEALESIAVLEPDPALPLEAHLAYFLATAYPPVTGVTIFKGNEGPNSTTDGIIQALSKVLTTKSNPWLMVLEFAEDEDRSVSAALSTLGLVSRQNSHLHLLTLQLPPPTLIFSDAFSTRRSFVAAITHAALGDRPIALPFFTGSQSTSLGVHADNIAGIVMRSIEVTRKAKGDPAFRNRDLITELDVRLPDEQFTQWDLTERILDWTSSLSPVSRRPTGPGPVRHDDPTTPEEHAKLELLLGPVSFPPILDSARKYVTSLLALHHQFLLRQNGTLCSAERLEPSANERKATILQSNGCDAQLDTLGEDGKWWSVACSGDFPEGYVDEALGSVVAARAIPAGGTLPGVGVEFTRTKGMKGKAAEVFLRIKCPASSTRTHPPKFVGDQGYRSYHGFWNASSSGGVSGWRDVDAWYPSPGEAGGKMLEGLVVDFAEGEKFEAGFGLRLPQGSKKDPKVWIHVEPGRVGATFRAVTFRRASRPSSRFRVNPVCCAKGQGGSTGNWAGIEDDPIATSQVYFRSAASGHTTEGASRLAPHQCAENSRALSQTQALLERLEQVKPAVPPPSPPTLQIVSLAADSERIDARPICPQDCQAPIACIASPSCRCTTDRCGVARQRQPGWLSDSPTSFLLSSQLNLPVVKTGLVGFVSAIPLKSLILPLARHSFESSLLRPRVALTSRECTAAHPASCAESLSDSHLSPLAEISHEVAGADFTFLVTPQSCGAAKTAARVACALDEEHGRLPTAYANSLEYGSCFGDWRRIDDSVSGARVATSAVAWQVDGSWTVPCFNPDRDIVVPPEIPAQMTFDIINTYSNVSLVKGASSRRYLAIFSGEVEEGYGAFARTRLGCGVAPGTMGRRTILYNQLGRHLVLHKSLGESTFCLLPRGVTGIASRLGEALWAGCIPVLISDNAHPPFHDILDYSLFSISIPELHLARLHDILKSYTDAEVQLLQAHGLRVRDFLMWRKVGGDDGKEISGALRMALVGMRMRIGGEGGGPLATAALLGT